MAYTDTNYKSKKAVKDALAAGVRITCYQPNGDITGASVPDNGTVYLEGPHYPKPHSWYGQGVMKDGYLVSIK